MTPGRIACRAVFLDAGGVIVLPDRHLLAGALAGVGINIDPGAVPSAHYRAVRALDRPDQAPTPTPTAAPAPTAAPGPKDYPRALFPQLGIVPGRTAEALAVWERLSNRTRSGVVLWSELTPGALETIASLERAGLAVVIVTNSDGHAAENLAACGVCGVPVVDSVVVGAEKPDVRMFSAALAVAGDGIAPADVVHVGDTLPADVAGARAAGITPVHFDPLRACRARDHRHVRSLSGLWHHLAPA
jgi:putative hydrolase of the HAD superfamily